MSNERFEPDEHAAYGRCRDCGIDLVTEAVAKEHMTATLNAAQSKGVNASHSIGILNQTKKQRIDASVNSIVDDAISAALDKLESLVSRGDATEDEIGAALSWWTDFDEAWDQRKDERETSKEGRDAAEASSDEAV